MPEKPLKRFGQNGFEFGFGCGTEKFRPRFFFISKEKNFSVPLFFFKKKQISAKTIFHFVSVF